MRIDDVLSHDEYVWTDVATRLCTQHPNVTVNLAGLILSHIGTDGTIVGAFDSGALKVLDIALRQHPGEVWQIASALLGPPIDARAFHIREWLKGGRLFGNGGSQILEKVPRSYYGVGLTRSPKFALSIWLVSCLR